MAIERRFKTATKQTIKLLEGGENEAVDFKKTPDGIHVEDLVAFANTDKGGNIILGISEERKSDGSQYGAITGCDISDGTVLKILNKAISCIPPVSVKIYAENTGGKAILRIFVPPSENKPHSTPKGVYCRRDGSRNRPLHPNELLEIFLDSEARAFAARFENAAGTISDSIIQLELSLESTISSMGDQLGWAEFKLGDTEDTISNILAYVRHLTDETEEVSTRLRALFRQDKRNDPVREKARKLFIDQIIEQLEDDPELMKKVLGDEAGNFRLSAKGKPALELKKDELQDAFYEALKIIREDSDQKQDKNNKNPSEEG